MTRRLVVFPNDPIYKYYEKGEIKPRYYNPCNFFGEVHFISLCDEEIEAERVQELVGTAKLTIHAIGRPRVVTLPLLVRRVPDLVRTLQPDVVRSYGNLIPGWMGVFCGKKLGPPTVVSIHNNLDKDHKELVRRGIKRRSLHNLLYWLWLALTEDYTLTNADKVICKYEFAAAYARAHGAREVEVIYNQIDTDRFVPLERTARSGRLAVLCVNRQDDDKDPRPILKAVKDLDVKLILIGDGILHGRLKKLAAFLGIADRVEFIRAVPHADIHRYYQQADIYAVSIAIGGISMGTMEAMACGLPVVYAQTPWEDCPEVVGELALMVAPTPEGFRAGIRRLAEDPELRARLGAQGRERILAIRGDLMEHRERELYAGLLKQCGGT